MNAKTHILTIPSWLKLTSSKEVQVQTVVIGLDKYRPGQRIELQLGRTATVWTGKGRFEALVTDSGLSVVGLHADGSRVSA